MTYTVPSAAVLLPTLRAVAVNGVPGEASVVALAAQMRAIVRARRAAGLAAPQLGTSVRLIVIARGREAVALLNPRIIDREGVQRSVEGCLSLPGVTVTVRRALRVTITGERPEGGMLTLKLSGREAAAAQHEVDHLNGILIVDSLSGPHALAVMRRFAAAAVAA